MILWVMGLGAVLAACQPAGVTGTPTATEGATVGAEEALKTSQAAGLATLHALETTTGPSLTDTPHPPITPAISLATVQPMAIPTFTAPFPSAFNGPLPPGAVARFGTGIIPVYPAALYQDVASPDGLYVAVPSGAGMHFYRTDTGEEAWNDTLEQLVYSMAWSPDGTMLAAGTRQGMIIVWDVRAGKRLHTLYAHNGTIVDTLAWLPDGSILVSGGSDARVIVWNARAGAALHALGGDWYGSTDVLIISPDGSKILSAYHAATDAPAPTHEPVVWDTQTGQALYLLDSGTYYSYSSLVDASWSADGMLLAIDDTIYMAETGEVFLTLEDTGARVWSPTGRLLATAGNGRVSVWDPLAGVVAWNVEGAPTELVWSPNGALLIGTDGGTVKVWDAHSGELLRTVAGCSGGFWIDQRSLQDNLLIVATDDRDPQIALCDVQSGTLVAKASIPDYLADIAWSPDRAVLVTGTASWATDSITLTDVRTGEVVSKLDGTKYVLSLAWSPDGKTLAVGSTDDSSIHQIAFWDVQAHTAIRNIGLTDTPVNLSWSPNGRLLAAGSHRGTFVWDAQTGLPAANSLLTGSPAAFSPRDPLFAVGDTIWNTVSGLKISTLNPLTMPLRDIAWSPDGMMLVTAGSEGGTGTPTSELILWDARTGSALRMFQGHELNVNSVAWSPDGTKIVSGASGAVFRDEEEWVPSWGNEVIIWDVASGEALLTLRDETLELTDVVWSPDGRTLAVAYGAAPEWLFGNGYDRYLKTGRIVLLDAQTGQQIRMLEGHSTSVQTIAFSPDGSLLASGSLDGTVILWDVGQ